MNTMDEKKLQAGTHAEDVESKSSDSNIDEIYSPEQQKKIIRRVDLRLVSMCGIMYCVSLMDRTNLSAASIAGMTKELRLDIGFRYSTVVLVFFVTYVLFQPPATVITKKLGPRYFLSTITLLWGSVMIAFGFVKNWGQLAGLRVLLGLLEAGFFPGAVFLLSTWYVRYDMQKRYSVFYIIGCVASALSGILAYGLMQMNGLSGLTGWRWIFVMEGVISCLIALAGYAFLVDFPETGHKSWNFLSRDECDFIMRRINKDRGDAVTEPFTLGRFLRPALDLKTWAFALLFCCSTTVTYAIAYFLPIILLGMGFSIGQAQCLVAPPYVFAGIWMFGSAYLADRIRLRAPFVVCNAILPLIGLPIMGFHSSNSVRYFGVFLVTAGANANVPTILTYQANNIRGQWKRAFCSAALVGMGGVGGIAGSLVFRSQDSPEYIPGIWACIAANLLILTVTGILSIYFWLSNKKAREGKKVIEGLDGFYYTL